MHPGQIICVNHTKCDTGRNFSVSGPSLISTSDIYYIICVMFNTGDCFYAVKPFRLLSGWNTIFHLITSQNLFIVPNISLSLFGDFFGESEVQWTGKAYIRRLEPKSLRQGMLILLCNVFFLIFFPTQGLTTKKREPLIGSHQGVLNFCIHSTPLREGDVWKVMCI